MTFAIFALALAFADSTGAATADSARAPIDSAAAVHDSSRAPLDSTLAAPVDSASAARIDSTAAPSDSATAAPRSVYRPHSAIASLSDFRLEWSAPERVAFREPNDPMEPVALATVAHILRLQPGVRTRELSQGPGQESFAFNGAGSSASDLRFDGSSIVIPGTSGPHSEDVVLSEIGDVSILRGSAAALYGPQAASGATVLRPRFPHAGELLVRVVGEEGSDEYQRASFQGSRHLGENAGFFGTMELRQIEGFFPETKEFDRQYAGRVGGRLPFGLEGEASFRRFEGDARSGGVDTLAVLPVVTRATHVGAKLFRAWDEARGGLLEMRFHRESIDNVDPSAPRKREITGPELQATVDLPPLLGLESTVRAEASRWRVEYMQISTIDRFWRTAAALRTSRAFGAGIRLTGTARLDTEEERDDALHARVEGIWAGRAWALSGAVAHGERIPAREAPLPDVSEVHDAATARLAWTGGPATLSTELDWTRVEDIRPEPSFEEVRRRDPADAVPIGTGDLRGLTFGVVTDPFPIPGAAVVGDLTFRTTFALRDDVLDETGAPLPGRARRLWTGEGLLSNEFFQDSLHARLRGRLTYLGDRVDVAFVDVLDAWVTDVIAEAEIADALLHIRFHDLLERGDEIEPGYRLPGFSWMFGVSWRFWG